MKKDKFSKNEYQLPVITRGVVKIEWVNLGEGYDGDYDPENPDDVNLLRFDVSKKVNGEWTEAPQQQTRLSPLTIHYSPFTLFRQFSSRDGP